MRREGLPVVAVGAGACVACCAPPILGALGLTLGVAAVAWLALGLLAAAIVVLVGLLAIRRQRQVPA